MSRRANLFVESTDIDNNVRRGVSGSSDGEWIASSFDTIRQHESAVASSRIEPDLSSAAKDDIARRVSYFGSFALFPTSINPRELIYCL